MAITVGLTAGGFVSSGPGGADAYQVWLAAGNTGSVAVFLASLAGPPGPKGENGQPGATGPAGPAGQSTIALLSYEYIATADGSQLIQLPQAAGNYRALYINGLKQPSAAFDIGGTTLSIPSATGVQVGDSIEAMISPIK